MDSDTTTETVVETTTVTPDVVTPDVAVPPDATPAAEGAPATDTTPPVTVIEEREIVGRVNGQTHTVKIPKGFELPWKRGAETGYAPFEEIEKSPNFERDYQHKMQALARERRELEAEATARRVEADARIAQAAENRKRMIDAAAKGGEALDRERRHQELLETDPDYRQRWEESEEWRIRERLETHHADVRQQETLHAQAEAIQGYIAREVQKYPGVDPDRVRILYSQALQAGSFQRLHADDIDELIRGEVALIERGRGTVTTENESLKAELAAIKAERIAAEHKATVAATIAKTGRAPAGQRPARGAVVGEAPFQPYNPEKETLSEFRARYRARNAGAA